jgi:hypothetical protein
MPDRHRPGLRVRRSNNERSRPSLAWMTVEFLHQPSAVGVTYKTRMRSATYLALAMSWVM